VARRLLDHRALSVDEKQIAVNCGKFLQLAEFIIVDCSITENEKLCLYKEHLHTQEHTNKLTLTSCRVF
jgi:hypothetical protein